VTIASSSSPCWTGALYSVYRISVGVYLTIHFGSLIPWGTEVYSAAGMLPDAGLSPLASAFPSIFTIADSPLAVRLILSSLVGASLLITVGWWDRPAALWVWYGLACLFVRNPLTANPSLPVVGWLLIAHTVVPAGPRWSVTAFLKPGLAETWSMPRYVPLAAWVIMAVSYSYSGWTKLISPSWVDGSALAEVLANPLARPSALREMLLTAPPVLLRMATWSAVGLELLFAPLALSRSLRPIIWAAMLGMHVGLLVLVDFADLTVGMMLIHFITVDPKWLSPRKDASGGFRPPRS